MARQVCHIVLIVLLASAPLEASEPDWVGDLVHNVNARVRNIEHDVQHLTQNLEWQIQHSVRSALEQANKAIENMPRDAQGRIITNGKIITSNGGSAISVTSTNGGSKIVMSGYTSDGQPYVRTMEETNDGHYLEHNEMSFYPKTNTTERIHWKLDLTTPGAKPVIIKDEDSLHSSRLYFLRSKQRH